MILNNIQELHSNIRKLRYYYYEMHVSLVTDYEFDLMEKEYTRLCNIINIPNEIRITNFIGFDIGIPMNLINCLVLYKDDFK